MKGISALNEIISTV